MALDPIAQPACESALPSAAAAPKASSSSPNNPPAKASGRANTGEWRRKGPPVSTGWSQWKVGNRRTSSFSYTFHELRQVTKSRGSISDRAMSFDSSNLVDGGRASVSVSARTSVTGSDCDDFDMDPSRSSLPNATDSERISFDHKYIIKKEFRSMSLDESLHAKQTPYVRTSRRSNTTSRKAERRNRKPFGRPTHSPPSRSPMNSPLPFPPSPYASPMCQSPPDLPGLLDDRTLSSPTDASLTAMSSMSFNENERTERTERSLLSDFSTPGRRFDAAAGATSTRTSNSVSSNVAGHGAGSGAVAQDLVKRDPACTSQGQVHGQGDEPRAFRQLWPTTNATNATNATNTTNATTNAMNTTNGISTVGDPGGGMDAVDAVTTACNTKSSRNGSVSGLPGPGRSRIGSSTSTSTSTEMLERASGIGIGTLSGPGSVASKLASSGTGGLTPTPTSSSSRSNSSSSTATVSPLSSIRAPCSSSSSNPASNLSNDYIYPEKCAKTQYSLSKKHNPVATLVALLVFVTSLVFSVWLNNDQ